MLQSLENWSGHLEQKIQMASLAFLTQFSIYLQNMQLQWTLRQRFDVEDYFQQLVDESLKMLQDCRWIGLYHVAFVNAL